MEQLQYDLVRILYCWSFLFMLLFLYNIVVAIIFGSRRRFGSQFFFFFCSLHLFFVYQWQRKTAIKSNFKFMAARIKWIFIRKMILKQDTHCKSYDCLCGCCCCYCCCCMLFLAYVQRANQIFNDSFVLRLQFFAFGCLFLSLFFSSSFIFFYFWQMAHMHSIYFKQILFYHVIYAMMMGVYCMGAL